MSIKIIPRTSENRAALNTGKSMIQRAIIGALNDVAFEARAGIQNRIRTAFDRPVQGVIRAVNVVKADSTRLKSTVRWSSNDADFNRRLEQIGRLQEEGGTLRPGQMGRKKLSIPTRRAPQTASGNLQRGYLGRIIESGRGFVDDRGARTTIFLRRGKKEIIPIAILKEQTSYRPRLAFRATAMNIGRNSLGLFIARRIASRGAGRQESNS